MDRIPASEVHGGYMGEGNYSEQQTEEASSYYSADILSREKEVEVPSGYEFEQYIPDLLIRNSGLSYPCFSGILLVQAGITRRKT